MFAGDSPAGCTALMEIWYRGFASASDCLAQHAAMPVRASPRYQTDLVLTHAAYASLFKQQDCFRPFSCQDGTRAGLQLTQT